MLQSVFRMWIQFIQYCILNWILNELKCEEHNSTNEQTRHCSEVNTQKMKKILFHPYRDWSSEFATGFQNVPLMENLQFWAYVQEVRFSGGGAKKYSPYVYPPIFRGGARCRQVYPEGDRCIFFFQWTKKSQVYLLGVARCISRFSEGGWLHLDVFRCILA